MGSFRRGQGLRGRKRLELRRRSVGWRKVRRVITDTAGHFGDGIFLGWSVNLRDGEIEVRGPVGGSGAFVI